MGRALEAHVHDRKAEGKQDEAHEARIERPEKETSIVGENEGALNARAQADDAEDTKADMSESQIEMRKEEAALMDIRVQLATAHSTGSRHVSDAATRDVEARLFSYGDAVRDSVASTDRIVLHFINSGGSADVHAVPNAAEGGRLEAMKVVRVKPGAGASI